MDRRIRSLTSFRALAAALVFFFHTVGHDSLPGPLFVLRYGWAGVSLFFALSGFLFTYLYLDAFTAGAQSLKVFFLKRVFRVYPLYFVLLVITAVTTTTGDAWNLLAHLTMTHGFFVPYRVTMIPPAWTLSVEESFYLVTPLLLLLLGKLPTLVRIKRPAATLAVQALILLVLCNLSWDVCRWLVEVKKTYTNWEDYELWTTTIFGRFSDFAYGIAAGVVALRFPQSPIFRNRIVSTLVFLSGCAVFAGTCRWIDLNGGVHFADKLHDFAARGHDFGLAGGLLVLGLCGDSFFRPLFDNRPAEYLGRISFALYLCQYAPIGAMLKPSLWVMDGMRSLTGADWAASILTYAILNCWAATLHHLVEAPAHRWLTMRFLPRSRPMSTVQPRSSTGGALSPAAD